MKVFSGGKVHLCAQMCPTCVFRPGNFMKLRPGRLAGMVKDSIESESAITCHETLYGQSAQEAICRGFWDRHWRDVMTLRLAIAVDIVEEV